MHLGSWMNSLAILDVGHGSCAVVFAGSSVSVIDAGTGTVLTAFLAHVGVDVVDAVLVSHADADHCAGLIALLSDPSIKVRRIFVNPDSTKGTLVWSDLTVAIALARKRAQTRTTTALTTDTTADLQEMGLPLQVLAPPPEKMMRGPGAVTRQDGRLSSNSCSAVIRVCPGETGIALLCADMDRAAFETIASSGADISAEIVVFPHHGGLVQTLDERLFARRLMECTGATLAVFSNGRGRFGTPRPAVAEGVRQAGQAPRIACTQLSEHCCPGTVEDRRCAGDLEFPLSAPAVRAERLQEHARRVDTLPSPLCRA